jgi:signal peptide peptidase SppA
MKYQHILRAFFNQPWALRPEKFDEIAELIRLKCEGVNLGAYQAAKRPSSEQAQGIALIPVFGTITQRATLMSQHSGATSLDELSGMLRTAMAEPQIGSIVLDVDSPGGSVFGLEEFAAELYQASKKKHIVAVANAQAASAAYWIASQASEFVMTPSGEVGSVGVIAKHYDESQALEKEGVKVTTITAGKFKGEGGPDQPLTDEAVTYLQSRVDDYYDSFVKAVARGRKVSVKDVQNGFGQGRMLGSKQALTAGMVDRIATLDDVIGGLISGVRPATRMAAEEAPVEITAEMPSLASILQDAEDMESGIQEKLRKLGYVQ